VRKNDWSEWKILIYDRKKTAFDCVVGIVAVVMLIIGGDEIDVSK
jgi:hypothetical protein